MSDDDTINNAETYGIHKNPLRDYLLWIFVIAVIVFGVCWFILGVKWILMIVIIVVSLGFGLPRWQGWRERQRRVRNAKKREEEKWGFHSREREGPWINYIDYPLVKKIDYAKGKCFYSEWLVIQDGYIMVNPGKSAVDLDNNTVTYDFTEQRGYAWDGCTPKKLFYWLAVIGTPDWFQRIENILMLKKKEFCDKPEEKETNVMAVDNYELEGKEVFWQQTLHASLIHDVLYQYLDTIPISKRNVDKLFYEMLRGSGVWWFIARLYHFGVKYFGAWGIGEDDPKGNSKFKVKDFPEIKQE